MTEEQLREIERIREIERRAEDWAEDWSPGDDRKKAKICFQILVECKTEEEYLARVEEWEKGFTEEKNTGTGQAEERVYRPVQCTGYKKPTFYDSTECGGITRLLCEQRDEQEVEEMDLIEGLPTHNSDETVKF